MTTANHPENQQPQGGATNLGQISKKPASRYLPWVIVEFSGSDRETIVASFQTAREAYRHLERHYCEEALADVMKRQPDGTLTTEF